jgi:hypothetical protein
VKLIGLGIPVGQGALSLFRTQRGELNLRITAWNLNVPAAGFQRKMIDVEKEVRHVEHVDEIDLPN